MSAPLVLADRTCPALINQKGCAKKHKNPRNNFRCSFPNKVCLSRLENETARGQLSFLKSKRPAI